MLEPPQTLLQKTSYLDPIDKKRLKEAYSLAYKAHDGMKRRSGEPYIIHPVIVTEILAELKLDADALIAGLLHDTVEDTELTFEELEEKFGEGVRKIVEGETKISKLSVRVYEDEQSENLRQMLLAMSKDVRIIMVKLADRLHNMRTLEHMIPEKQKRIAKETIEIFAPLAHRLGIGNIQRELENLGFFYLEPERYKNLEKQVRVLYAERESYVDETIKTLEERLKNENLEFEISGRSKHLYSIYKKMQREQSTLDQIFDLMAIRIIIDTAEDKADDQDFEKALCYKTLGIVHSMWSPIQGRFKDYLAMPKTNGYQSLHTTVIGIKGSPIEVQIRTRQMHEIAEYGVAAHWGYKAGIEKDTVGEILDWMRELEEFNSTEETAGAFLETVKTDLFTRRVHVFTPAGDVMSLSAGSTPIDFAYQVHTEVGHRCIGARVNGEIVPLSYKLRMGDRVEILTNRNPKYGPSSDWINIATTRSAKQKIRHFFGVQKREGQLQNGRTLLERALRRKKLSIKKYTSKANLLKASQKLFDSDYIDDIYLALDSKRISGKQIIEILAPEIYKDRLEPQKPKKAKPRSKIGGIYAEGLDVPANLAKCCSPVRGDDVIGYITRGRGVSVHRINCPNVKHLLKTQKERFLNVTWNAPGDDVFLADFEVLAVDRPGLLKDVLDVIAAMNKSASRVTADVHDSSSARIHFRIDVKDNAEIQIIKSNIMRIPDVSDIYRVKPGLKS